MMAELMLFTSVCSCDFSTGRETTLISMLIFRGGGDLLRRGGINFSSVMRAATSTYPHQFAVQL
jgi:hypothetical protein